MYRGQGAGLLLLAAGLTAACAGCAGSGPQRSQTPAPVGPTASTLASRPASTLAGQPTSLPVGNAAALGLGLGPQECDDDWLCDNFSHWAPKCHPQLKVCAECVTEEDCSSPRRICTHGHCVLACMAVLQCMFDLCGYECALKDGCVCDPSAICEIAACPTARAIEQCFRRRCPTCFTEGFKSVSCGKCYPTACRAEMDLCGDSC